MVRSAPFNVTDSCFEPPSSGFGDTFNVMTFNTWHSAQYGYGGLERVAEIIADLDIDIIGFHGQTIFHNVEESVAPPFA